MTRIDAPRPLSFKERRIDVEVLVTMATKARRKKAKKGSGGGRRAYQVCISLTKSEHARMKTAAGLRHTNHSAIVRRGVRLVMEEALVE